MPLPSLRGRAKVGAGRSGAGAPSSRVPCATACTRQHSACPAAHAPSPYRLAVDHGVFQMPTDACPSNFTGFATDTYQELAPSSTVRGQGGGACGGAPCCAGPASRHAAAAWAGQGQGQGVTRHVPVCPAKLARVSCWCGVPYSAAPGPPPSPLQSGNFTWQLPAAPGDYWVTSQANQDCADGGPDWRQGQGRVNGCRNTLVALSRGYALAQLRAALLRCPPSPPPPSPHAACKLDTLPALFLAF